MHRKSVLVPGVDQFVGRRGDVGQDTEPRVRIRPFPGLPNPARHCRATRAERPVASGDHCDVDAHLRAGSIGERDVGRVGFDVVQCSVRHLVVDLLTRCFAGRDQILRHLGLAVHPDATAHEIGEVDVVTLLRPLKVDAPMFLAFGVQPSAEADVVEQLNRRVLENSGADTREHVLLTPRLDDDGLHALLGEQVGQEQTGRACADDDYFCTHAVQ